MATPDTNIVILTDAAFYDGGIAKVALRSALGLQAAGQRIHVIAATGPVEPELQRHAVPVTLLNIPRIVDKHAVFSGLWNPAAARRLAAAMADFDPKNTIVHLHAWTKALTSSVVPALIRQGFRIVLTCHDYAVICPNAALYDYPGGKVCHRRPMRAACLFHNCDSRSAAHKAWRILRHTMQSGPGNMPGGLSGVITISDLSDQTLASHLPAGLPRWRVDNPIETGPRRAAKPGSGSVITYIGRLSPEKGPDILAQAARIAGVKVTFLGDGPMRRGLELKFPQHDFRGWVDFPTVRSVLHQARAVVLPSRCTETLGMAVPEAMAQGVPPVVGSHTAAAKIVRDHENGLIYTQDEEHSLEHTLTRLQDSGLVARLGQAAFDDFWATPPTLERHVRTLLKIYRQVLDPPEVST